MRRIAKNSFCRCLSWQWKRAVCRAHLGCILADPIKAVYCQMFPSQRLQTTGLPHRGWGQEGWGGGEQRRGEAAHPFNPTRQKCRSLLCGLLHLTRCTVISQLLLSLCPPVCLPGVPE